MDYNQITGELRNKIYKSVYFLSGEEPYYIDEITNFIIDNVLTPVEKDFNQTILYGKETNVPAIISAARRYPMMANYQVIVVKEAQNIKNIEDLLIYVENPLRSTILVINYKYKTLDKRKKLGKLIDKTGVLFESKRKYENEIPAWINNYLTSKKYSISADASKLLSDYLGVDLSKIVNELEKLIITLPEGERNINSDHIGKNIGISKEYNIFELNKALGKKNAFKSNQIINYFGKNPKNNPFVLIVTNLYSYFIKVLTYHEIKDKNDNNNVASILGVNAFFINDYRIAAQNYNKVKLHEIISILREYDLKSKGVNDNATSDNGLLKEMIYKILH
jgi:DNA polymerase III subunit delta